MADGLFEKLQRLIALTGKLHQERAHWQARAEQLEAENQAMQQAIAQSHAEITDLIGQVERLRHEQEHEPVNRSTT